LIAAGIKLALELLGPVIVSRTRRAVDEASGKFSSDWRRQRYVKRELKKAIRLEARIIRVPRSVQRFIVELLVIEKLDLDGVPLVITYPQQAPDPTDKAGA
jgi:hypothetical protein